MNSPTCHLIDPPVLGALFSALQERNYAIIGPTLRDNSIVYDEIMSTDELPTGLGDEQMPGAYRLREKADKAVFGFNLGPHSWKKFLFPPAVKLFAATRENGRVVVDGSENAQVKPYAFIGVRACELQAIRLQDQVFTSGGFIDAHYASLREHSFIVAVNCAQSAATCFCVSMNSGPEVGQGFDLCLTEVLGDGVHYFLIQAGSDKGAEILEEIPHREPSPDEIEAGDRVIDRTTRTIRKKLDTTDIKLLLQHNSDHPRWDAVANRCLSCANCTMVCPTCFCHNIEDTTDLTGNHAERWRKWDSCFTLDFSYIHGGSIRTSRKSRYRQWITHKLANWEDQFGSSGCVGCGRCITWCPVGIDITEEISVLRESATLPTP